jgi:hypothetical protein
MRPGRDVRIVFLTYPGLTALDAIGPCEVFNALRAFELCFARQEIGPIAADAGHVCKVRRSLALEARPKMNRTAAANPRDLLSAPKILLERWRRPRRRNRR